LRKYNDFQRIEAQSDTQSLIFSQLKLSFQTTQPNQQKRCYLIARGRVLNARTAHKCILQTVSLRKIEQIAELEKFLGNVLGRLYNQ
jgi:hypothetical protein